MTTLSAGFMLLGPCPLLVSVLGSSMSSLFIALVMIGAGRPSPHLSQPLLRGARESPKSAQPGRRRVMIKNAGAGAPRLGGPCRRVTANPKS